MKYQIDTGDLIRIHLALGELIASLEFDIKKYQFEADSYHVQCLRNAKETQRKMLTLQPIEE